ncbi:uncharacterized protein LOC131026687 isoform X2 [Cryptomeria japonica]|uniref:uncharacterized protein LOC131026687 isoform X2 n=1 Tax=Cryptomeria japonica TaxID=3369 RepID=UPI0025ABD2ED|nr:uncharacterized protein LOC131026687 isoform X2 [Cryptomeria japonica]
MLLSLEFPKQNKEKKEKTQKETMKMGSQEHQHPIIIFDAWMREAGEAKQLVDEIESHIRERDSVMAAGADPSYHVLTAARRKLMVVGTKLDRLESLIHNPPTKPILSSVQDAKANLQLEKEKVTCPNNSNLSYFQGQNVKDKEPLCSETDKKHMVISVEEESNLQIPLLESVDKDGNSNQSSQGVHKSFLLGSRCSEKCQLMINLFLLIVAIVIIVFIIVAAIKSI